MSGLARITTRSCASTQLTPKKIALHMNIPHGRYSKAPSKSTTIVSQTLAKSPDLNGEKVRSLQSTSKESKDGHKSDRKAISMTEEEDLEFKIHSLATHLSRVETICADYKESLEFTQSQVEDLHEENGQLRSYINSLELETNQNS